MTMSSVEDCNAVIENLDGSVRISFHLRLFQFIYGAKCMSKWDSFDFSGVPGEDIEGELLGQT